MFLTLVGGEAFAGKRVALVVGNGAYDSVPQLPNPVRDAEAMAALFKRAGFDVVTVRTNVGNLDFKRAVRDFKEAAVGAEAAVIFYAGHGIQISDMNYLIPVDARLAGERDAEDEAISLQRLVLALEPVSGLRLIILDACRDNPFATRVKTGRQTTTGLGQFEPPLSNMLIAYAARAGSTATDGDTANSPFTTALLKHLTQPGLDIRLAFGRVRDEVMKMTSRQQEPFVYGSLGGGIATLVPAPQQSPNAAVSDVRRDYDLVEAHGTRNAWEVFIGTHKTGFYVELAKAQLAKLIRVDGGPASALLQNVPPGPVRDDRLPGRDKQQYALASQEPLRPTPTDRPPSTDETRDWERVKNSQDPAKLRQFIEKHPTSSLSQMAERQAEMLERFARERDEKARLEREAVQRREQEERQAKAAEAARRQAEREEARRREEDERQAKIAEAARQKSEREAARKREEDERRAKVAEETRLRAEREAARKREEDERRAEREAARQREDEERKAQAAARKREDEERRAKIAEAERLAGERRTEEQRAKAAEVARLKAEQEAAAKREADARRAQQEAAAKRAEEDRLAKAAEAARVKGEQEAAAKREADARRAQQEAAAKRAEEERRAKAAEAARAKTEKEALAKREADDRRAKEEAVQSRLAYEAALLREEDERQAAVRRQVERERGERKQAGAPPRQDDSPALNEARLGAACEREETRLSTLQASNPSFAHGDLYRMQQELSCERLRPFVVAALDKFDPAPPAEGALVPAPAIREQPTNTLELVRTAQNELSRIGCFAGAQDGLMNDDTRSAIARYFAKRGEPAKNFNVTERLVADLKAQPGRLCPPSCQRGTHPEGDRCIADAKPSKAKVAKTSDDDAPSSKKASREREKPSSKKTASRSERSERPQREAKPRQQSQPQSQARQTASSGSATRVMGVGF